MLPKALKRQHTYTPLYKGVICCFLVMGSFCNQLKTFLNPKKQFNIATIRSRFCSWIETDLQRTKLNTITYVSLIVLGPQRIKGRKTNGLVWAYFMPHQENLTRNYYE